MYFMEHWKEFRKIWLDGPPDIENESTVTV